MAISFNTSATNTATNITQSTHPTLTVPAGVLTGDTMYVCVSVFTSTPTTPDITITSTAGSTWTNIGGGIRESVAFGGLNEFGKLWTRTATAADPSDTLTFAFTGTGSGGFWWSLAVVSYTGTGGTDVNAGVGGATTGVNLTPTTSTVTAGDWAIYFACIAVAASGSINGVPSGTTQRVNIVTAGISLAIADSNASVGGAGTSIGNNSFSTTSGPAGGSNDQWCMFTVGLAPASVAGPLTTLYRFRST